MNGFELRWVRCHVNETCAVGKSWPMKLQYRQKTGERVQKLLDDLSLVRVEQGWSKWIDVPMGDSE